MLEFEKGYVIGDKKLDWLEIESVINFHHLASLQIDLVNEYHLSDEKSLDIANKVLSMIKTLDINEDDAIDMVMQVEMLNIDSEKGNEE